MARHRLFTVAAALVLAVLASPGRAQDKPEPPQSEPPKAPAPAKAERPDRPEGATLRVLLVISRFEGEKKLASLPYTFTVTSDGQWARMRMGVDTPIPVSHVVTGSGDAKPPASYQYRSVGTKLDCRARATKDGRYQLEMSVENSSALSGTGAGMPPLFRTFNVNLDPILRDGQSIQTVASTDPVTGEVVKIDVTMNVVKQ
jgi:hypothetical protein